MKYADNCVDVQITVNDGNSTRLATLDEIKGALGISHCLSPDCSQELAAYGQDLGNASPFSRSQAREQYQSMVEAGHDAPIATGETRIILTDASTGTTSRPGAPTRTTDSRASTQSEPRATDGPAVSDLRFGAGENKERVARVRHARHVTLKGGEGPVKALEKSAAGS